MLPLTFSNFLGSNNASILWSLKLLLPKTSASTFYCFQIYKKTARQFKILSILYFYCFIIIFKLTLQQMLLVIEWNEVKNFCQQMCNFAITFAFENTTKIRYDERERIRQFLSALSIYFSQGNFANWKHSITIFWRYLRLIWRIFVKKQ